MNKSVVTIGLFDGVHVGHREVITRTVAEAKTLGLASVAVTFDRHPSDILQPGHGPLLLTTPAAKRTLIEELGVDRVLIVPFTAELAAMEPKEFLDNVIMPLSPAKIIVGADFKFGRMRAGDTVFLSDYADKHGVLVESLRLHAVNGEKASSSVARRHILDGEIEAAAAILGRYPTFYGRVEHGDKRGRELGFPTANIKIAESLCLPQDGVYAGTLTAAGKTYIAAINVGLAPTFGGRKEPLIEAMALGFEGDLYGLEATVEFRARLRGEIKFDDPEDLVKQIAADAQKARTMIELSNTLKGG